MHQFSVSARIFAFFRPLSWQFDWNYPPDTKENIFLLKNELFSFVQCFGKAICRNCSWAVHLSGPYYKIPTAQGTNQNSPFRRGPICHIINANNKTGTRWPSGQRFRVWIERSWIKCCPGSLCWTNPDSSPVVFVQRAARREVKSARLRRKGW